MKLMLIDSQPVLSSILPYECDRAWHTCFSDYQMLKINTPIRIPICKINKTEFLINLNKNKWFWTSIAETLRRFKKWRPYYPIQRKMIFSYSETVYWLLNFFLKSTHFLTIYRFKIINILQLLENNFFWTKPRTKATLVCVRVLGRSGRWFFPTPWSKVFDRSVLYLEICTAKMFHFWWKV